MTGLRIQPDDDRRRRFELLALPHLDAAYNLARWLAGNPTDAEDIVQDAYLRAYRYFDTVRGGKLRVWLLAIVRNVFFTWAKENRSGRMVCAAETPAGENVKSVNGSASRVLRYSSVASPIVTCGLKFLPVSFGTKAATYSISGSTMSGS